MTKYDFELKSLEELRSWLVLSLMIRQFTMLQASGLLLFGDTSCGMCSVNLKCVHQMKWVFKKKKKVVNM